ncbi:hypothetical protein Pcinc_009275 [Petrolisthes cinctipes]|uniref:Uncharacterized protein n=1 Tax=Petrolisthes cinctipes TaxID=88211 RepID=A0AAE1KWJ2_PETCI|nr:hypothetical protein Pcinc_009275 [Petrolisthes cinctipes]
MRGGIGGARVALRGRRGHVTRRRVVVRGHERRGGIGGTCVSWRGRRRHVPRRLVVVRRKSDLVCQELLMVEDVVYHSIFSFLLH